MFAKVPQYLVLDVDHNNRSICRSIVESVLPYTVRHISSDKDLVQSLFGNKFNPTYLTHVGSDETTPIRQGRLCSNTSNQWISLTYLDKGFIIFILYT